MLTRGPATPGLILIPPGRRRASRVCAANSSLAPARGYFEPPSSPSAVPSGARVEARGEIGTLSHAGTRGGSLDILAGPSVPGQSDSEAAAPPRVRGENVVQRLWQE